MTIEELLKEKIQEKLEPLRLEVINESHKHAGHAGDDGSGQTHFKLMIVSGRFEGCSRMQRHRLVYGAINELFSVGLHAISIDAKAPSEIS